MTMLSLSRAAFNERISQVILSMPVMRNVRDSYRTLSGPLDFCDVVADPPPDQL